MLSEPSVSLPPLTRYGEHSNAVNNSLKSKADWGCRIVNSTLPHSGLPVNRKTDKYSKPTLPPLQLEGKVCIFHVRKYLQPTAPKQAGGELNSFVKTYLVSDQKRKEDLLNIIYERRAGIEQYGHQLKSETSLRSRMRSYGCQLHSLPSGKEKLTRMSTEFQKLAKFIEEMKRSVAIYPVDKVPPFGSDIAVDTYSEGWKRELSEAELINGTSEKCSLIQ